MIKGNHQALCPTLPQVGFHLPPQGPHPVSLPGSGYKGRPAPLLQPVGHTQADGLNRGPESTQISLRPQPHHTSTQRTSIPPQPQPFTNTIKIGQHIPMSPYPTHPAPRTHIGSGPRVIPAPCKDLLDLRCNKEYQDLSGWGIDHPPLSRAVLFP